MSKEIQTITTISEPTSKSLSLGYITLQIVLTYLSPFPGIVAFFLLVVYTWVSSEMTSSQQKKKYPVIRSLRFMMKKQNEVNYLRRKMHN